MAKAKGKAVAQRKGPGTDVASPADIEAMLAADSGVGFEEAGRDAFAIPFLRILQDLSPQVKPKMGGFVKGAKVGDIFNTVTKACTPLDTPLRVIPCHFSQRFIEWVPRTKKGGFVAAYDAVRGAQLMQTTQRDATTGRNVLPNGNELMDSREHYVLMLNPDGTTEGALIAMASTGLKVSRRWMAQMRNSTIVIGGKSVPAPMFAFSYEMGREEEANDQGSWWTWAPQNQERVLDPDVYIAAKTFGAAMRAGAGKINYDELRDNAASQGGAQRAAPHGGLNDMDDDAEGGM